MLIPVETKILTKINLDLTMMGLGFSKLSIPPCLAKYANAFKLNAGILGADVFRIDEII